MLFYKSASFQREEVIPVTLVYFSSFFFFAKLLEQSLRKVHLLAKKEDEKMRPTYSAIRRRIPVLANTRQRLKFYYKLQCNFFSPTFCQSCRQTSRKRFLFARNTRFQKMFSRFNSVELSS